MASKIGTKIVLEGEKEYRDALKDISKQQEVFNSEMQLAKSTFQETDDEQAKLVATGKILEKQVAAQTDKIEIMKKALADSAVQLGENDKKTLNWQIQVNKAETYLNKLNKELDENTNLQQDYQKETDDSINKTEQYEKAVDNLSDSFGTGLTSGVKKSVFEIDGATVALGASAVVLGGIITSISDYTKEITANAKEIVNVSQIMGLTTTEYQELDYVLKTVGSSAESAQGDLSALAEKALDAANGVGEGAELFGKLKINVESSKGSLKSQAELFDEVVEALKDVNNETERNAIASALLSTTGEQLVPILNMTTQEYEALKQAAYDTGAVLSEESITKFNELGRVTEDFNTTLDAAKSQILIALLPALTLLLEAFSSLSPEQLSLIITLTATIAMIVGMVAAIKKVTGTVSDVKSFFNTFDVAAIKTTAIVIGIVAALIALAIIIAVIMGRSKELEQSMQTVGSSIGGIAGNAFSSNSSYPTNPSTRIPMYAKGTSYHQGGLAIVGEDGPEVVNMPRGSKVYTNQESQGMLGGNVNNYNFNVDNIATYQQIEQKYKNERQRGRSI